MHTLDQFENQTNRSINMDQFQQRLESLSNTHGHQMNVLNHLLEQKQAILLMIDFFENVCVLFHI